MRIMVQRRFEKAKYWVYEAMGAMMVHMVQNSYNLTNKFGWRAKIEPLSGPT